ncbi:MAG: undecaprenyl/decaprenyl-phosphate alpha-N-acetylglucosaminyl 1-phosphate transferase [Fimbriimonadaceae bacterium]|nr:MAG: undecaprenyl/decaprenyl-phosphate alpha-N-acetylglucosaminyl 1-phosphate transferase [Fimbriimonadaceae bacterium]
MFNQFASVGENWKWIFPGFRASLLAGFVALVVVLLVTPFVMKLAHKFGAVDDPTRDERRVHTTITPRWGGMAIYIGVLVSLLAVLPFAYQYQPFPPYLIAVLVGSMLIVGMGSLDDKVQLSAKVQLLYMLIIGIGVQFFFNDIGRVQIQGVNLAGNWINFGVWAFPLTAVYIFIVTKTMDTIDGIDGLASGIAAISAGTISIIASIEGQPRVALVAMAIAGACVGFLRYNYNPAKIFLGGGSQLLGFLLATLSIVGAMKTAATLALLIPLFIFGIPLFDAAFVVIRRIITKTPITQPDKKHVHHTLLGRGYTQKQAVWILYLIAITLSGAILLLVRNN